MTNYQLATKVKEKILAEPEHFNMLDFFDNTTERTGSITCNTTCCIAGWAQIILRNIPNLGISEEIRKYFGIANTSLFYFSEWPSNLKSRFQQTNDKLLEAQIACEAIDLYMKDIPEFEITSEMLL